MYGCHKTAVFSEKILGEPSSQGSWYPGSL